MQSSAVLETKTNTLTHDTRPCNNCARGRVPAFDSRKSCASCREKRSNDARRRRERLLAAAVKQVDIVSDTDTRKPVVSAPINTKRKAARNVEDDEENMSDVLSKMKKRLKTQITAATKGPTVASLPVRVPYIRW